MKKLLLLLTISLFLLPACEKENKDQIRIENHLKKGWKLTTSSINGSPVNPSSIPINELLYFSDQSLCYLATPIYTNEEWSYEDQRTAWSYDHSNGILNIAGLLPVTWYIEKIETNQLTIYYYQYNDKGELDTYKKNYQPAKVKVENLTIRLVE